MITTLSHRSKRPYVAFLLALCCVASAAPLDVAQVAKNPRAYHHQKVSLVGVAFVQGGSFILFQDRLAAKEYAGPPKSLPIAPREDAPTYENDKYNDCWVKITAVVDADRHGRWNFPCELLLKSVQRLSGPVVVRRTIYAVFRNETSRPVEVHLFNASGKYTRFELGPDGVEGFPAQPGYVEVTAAGGTVIAKNAISLPSPKQNFDTVNRAQYYRIKSANIDAVPASVGVTWGWHP